MYSNANVAIVLNDPTTYSETFIRRHVEHLFAGRTAVVSTTRSGAVAANRPTYALSGQPRAGGLLETPRAALRRLQGRLHPKNDALSVFLRAHRVRFVLAEFGPQGLAIYRQAKAARLPMYCYFRGYDASKLLKKPKYVADVREMCLTIDGIVAVSDSLLRNLAAAGISCAKEFVIPSGTDTADFTPSIKRPGSFLAVGRFIEKKAPQITLRAFARALGGHREYSLDMVGDGPELAECRALCAELGINAQVRFHGAAEHGHVKHLMRSAAYFLQHSVTARDGDSEGMPSAIQEALSCGCVVIATRHSGIPEHIRQDFNGVLIDEYSVDQYAAEITRLIDDVELSRAIAENARDYAVARLDYRVLHRRLELLIENELDCS